MSRLIIIITESHISMKKPYYLFSSGRLRRKQNTLFLEKTQAIRQPGDNPNDTGVPPDAPIAGRHPFPVEQVESIHLFGEIDINTKLITFLAKHQIPTFCFDYYGNFTASLYPRDYLLSGNLKVKQVQHYLQKQKRLILARAFVNASMANILRVLKYYATRTEGKYTQTIKESIQQIECLSGQTQQIKSISELMGLEGNSREMYYRSWPAILGKEGEKFPFDKRTRRPPSNELNALISFGNSLCYTTCMRQIYRTALDPTISFLHEPGVRRFSLSLDLAEIFKPLLVDRAIFRLIKTATIQPKHFESRLGGVYLKETGRKIFVEHWNERLRKTIQHRTLKRKISYERLIRLECYKLTRHLMEPKKDTYNGFRLWW